MNQRIIIFAALSALCILLLGLLIWLALRYRALSQQMSSASQSLRDASEKNTLLTKEKDQISDRLRAEQSVSQERLSELEALRSIVPEIADTRIRQDTRARLSRIGWGVRFDSERDYADVLKEATDHAEALVAQKLAVLPTGDAPVSEKASALLLDAFNGFVRQYTYFSNRAFDVREHYIRLAFYLVNMRAEAVLHAKVSKAYLDAQLSVLAIKGAMEEYKRQHKSEDIKASKLEDRLTKEEKRLQAELDKLRIRLQSAHAKEKASLSERIAELEQKIDELTPAMSNAQLTKHGTVYVISNIGSFGENVYKIGMTRRTDPQERIDELGVASVPFSFDVHTLIETDDAPRLEYELHQALKDNKVNSAALQGREFYRVPLEDVKRCVEKMGYHPKWNDEPDAEEYRISSGMPPIQPSVAAKDTEINEPKIENTPVKMLKSDMTFDEFIKYLDANTIPYVDKRTIGGCLWMQSSDRIDPLLECLTIDGKHLLRANKTKTFDNNPGWFIS